MVHSSICSRERLREVIQTMMSFTGRCPVCDNHYDMLDREAGHRAGGGEVFEVIEDVPDGADKGDRVERVCETCHTAGRVRRIVDR